MSDAGCTHLQGFLVARPMPIGQAWQWLSTLDSLRVQLP